MLHEEGFFMMNLSCLITLSRKVFLRQTNNESKQKPPNFIEREKKKERNMIMKTFPALNFIYILYSTYSVYIKD